MIHANTRRRQRRVQARDGSVLVLALLMSMLVAGMLACLFTLSMSATRRQEQASDNRRSLYVSEAGLNAAYAALTVGKTGTMGSQEAPASFGDGLFWVQATVLDEDRLQLESTGMVGRGRARLSMVLERDSNSVPALGFFASEELVVPPGVLIDGYDSRAMEYEDIAIFEKGILHSPGGGRAGSNDGIVLGAKETRQEKAEREARERARKEGAKKSKDKKERNKRAEEAEAAGRKTYVYGDASPGPSHEVEERGKVELTGSTEPREKSVEFPPIIAPDVPALPAVHHTGPVPMTLTGLVGYDGLTVASGAELVLRGPVTLVTSSLQVESGGSLVLDNEMGTVEVIASLELLLEEGSQVACTTTETATVSLQLDGIEPQGSDPLVLLAGTGAFYGSVYVPSASVKTSSDFEVFGSIAARRLELDRGSRLHYDVGLAGVSFGGTLPRQVAWRIVDVGRGPAGRLGPLAALGLTMADTTVVEDSHDVSNIHLHLEYLDSFGVKQKFTGWEEDFDWNGVLQVLNLKRHEKNR